MKNMKNMKNMLNVISHLDKAFQSFFEYTIWTPLQEIKIYVKFFIWLKTRLISCLFVYLG